MRTLLVSLAALFVAVSVGTAWSKSNRECGPGQFYSSFSLTCELATLQVGVGDKVRSFDIADLRAKFHETELTLTENPAYALDGTVNSVRKYKGIRLRDLIASLLPAGESLDGYVLATTCLDGFNPVLDASFLRRLDKMEAILAYRQSEIKGAKAGLSRDADWEMVTTEWGIQSPAPFYLVWAEAEGTYPQAWPFQLNSLRLIKINDYEETLNRLKPASEFMGNQPLSDVEDGYKQFSGKCLICHQINRIGGRKAEIDLKSLFSSSATVKDARDFLATVVKNPPPGMSEVKGMKLTEEDIGHLAAYLRHMSVERK